MLTLSPALKTALDAKPTQVEWANGLKALLGDALRFQCYRAADANAVDPSATGTKFLDCAITGFTVKGYKITSIGGASDITTSLAADLATGKAVACIVGNGHKVTIDLRLKGAPDATPEDKAKLYFSANPGASNAVAMKVSLNPPSIIASGTGYAPPPIDPDAPAYVVIENWKNPLAPVEVGRIHFNKRDKNFVFTDAEVAANMGDLRVMKSTEKVVYDKHEFGAMMFCMDHRAGVVLNKTLYDVIINFKPLDTNWKNYPRQTGATGGGFDPLTTDTFMSAFKARICKADNTVINVQDMPMDNTAINGDHLQDYVTKTKPLRLHTHCAALLQYATHDPKLNALAHKYFPGVTSDFLRPSLMKERASTNGAYPPTYPAQGDSNLQWFGVSKWPHACSAEAMAATQPQRVGDPYLWDLNGTVYNPWGTPGWAIAKYNIPAAEQGSINYGSALVMGWGYEPGSYSCHDQYSGPGGVRIDRSIIPTPYAIYMTDPNWVHLNDSTPISEMVKHWHKAYFNHATHHFDGDIREFMSVPTQEVLDGKWCFGNGYYAPNQTYTDLDHAIPLMAIANGPTAYADRVHWGSPTDLNGRMPWNGYSPDFFHNYHMPGWTVLLFSSPSHIIAHKFRYFASIMCNLNQDGTGDWDNHLVRDESWTLGQEAMAWKLASDHPTLGVPRAGVEKRIQNILTGLYLNIHLPVYVNNSQTMWAKALRNFGLSVTYGGYNQWAAKSFSLHFYSAQALQFWKQCGLWKVMWDRSQANRDAMTMMINHLDRASVDYYLDTNGTYSGSVYGGGIDLWVGDRGINSDSVEIATSWADWAARVQTAKGTGDRTDLVTGPNGENWGPDIGEFSRMQWPFIRRDYFADIPSERSPTAVADACALVQSWKNKVATRVAAATSPRNKTMTDWSAHPALGTILPPTILGD